MIGTSHSWRLLRALCICVLTLGVAPIGAAEPLFSGELHLMLIKALGHDPENSRNANLNLYLEANNGQWQDVWGKALDFTIGDHRGMVRSAKVSDERIRLDVDMLLLGDFWVKGSWYGRFEIDLERKADGLVEGTYRAAFKGAAYEGEVTGRLFPPREVEAGFQRPGPDEHPRLLFRQGDLPALREKLKTPFGQAYMEAVKHSGNPINLGVLYQLTGEKVYAERAQKALEAKYAGKNEIPVVVFGSGSFGHDIFEAVVAYDLCADAWTQEFKDWLIPQLEAFTERHQHILMTSHANFHPCSNYYGPGRGVPGVAAMVLWGDQGEAPKPPRDPFVRAWLITAAENFKPGKGVTVVEFKTGEVPGKWIWTGLLPLESSRDVLGTLGGYPKARPEVGARSEYLVKTEKWFDQALLEIKPLADGMVTDDGIAVGKAAEGDGGSVSVYFTAIRIDNEQVLRLEAGRKGVSVWLSGRELDEKEFYRVSPGVHPLLVELRAEKTTGVLAPKLHTVDADDNNPVLNRYRMEHALWQADMRRWDATGMAANRHLWLHRGWWQNMQHYLWGIGEGGFMAETGGYAGIASGYPSTYASMYPNFFGRDVSPYDDVDHIMVRQMMQAAFPADSGGPTILKLNSAITFNSEWMAMHFPIIPVKYQPALLWAWNRLYNVTDEASTVNVIRGSDRKNVPGGLTLAQNFVNYPLDMKPQHPSKVMPLTWAAKTFGHYIFRSGWEDVDAFVAQVFAKSAPVVGWNHPNAGAVRLWGLGHAWTDAPEDRNGTREQYSVVLLPDDEIAQGCCGRITHYDPQPDGSGTLTINLDDVYAKKSRQLYDGMFVRDPEAFVPSGITGLRAIGYDYSGKSGAPALVVMVDRIDGGGRKVWTWQKPGAEVRVTSNGFTLRYPDASLQATFVTPGEVEVEATSEAVEIGEARTGFRGTLHRVKATGGDSYFVVMTLQRGDAPAVKVKGDGLNATVTVGGQTVRFDGKKVIFGN